MPSMIPDRLKRIRKGEPRRTDPVNAWISRLNWLGSRGVDGMDLGPGGYSYQASDYFYARLRGSAGTGSSPYSFDEVQGKIPGWNAVAGLRSGTTNAYEYNSKPNLGGKVVKMRQEGDIFRFNHVQRNGCHPIVRVHVNGCGRGPEKDAAVTMTQGATVVSQLTAASGETTFNPTNASASFSVSRARFDTQTFTLVPPCFNLLRTVNLVASAGYLCCPIPGCDPIPVTLNATDANASFQLKACGTVGTGPIRPPWTGGYSISMAGYALGGLGFSTTCFPAYSVSVAVQYILSCHGPSGWSLGQYLSVCYEYSGSGYHRRVIGYGGAPLKAAGLCGGGGGVYVGSGSGPAVRDILDISTSYIGDTLFQSPALPPTFPCIPLSLSFSAPASYAAPHYEAFAVVGTDSFANPAAGTVTITE